MGANGRSGEFGGMGVDPAVAAALGERRVEEGTREGERQSRRSPHEMGRAGRSMSVTFPGLGWKEALELLAEEWGPGVYKADVLVYAVSRLMQAWEQGAEGGPPRRTRAPWMRTGDVWADLPWRPEGEG